LINFIRTGEGIDEDGVGREGGGGGGGGIPPVCPPVGEEGICVCENYHLLWEEDNLCYRKERSKSFQTICIHISHQTKLFIFHTKPNK